MHQQMDRALMPIRQTQSRAKAIAVDWEWQIATREWLALQGQALLLYVKGYRAGNISCILSSRCHALIDEESVLQMVDCAANHLVGWMQRELQPSYAYVHIDKICIEVMEAGRTITKTAYALLALDERAQKDLLGLWLTREPTVAFWQGVFVSLHTRGVRRLLFVGGAEDKRTWQSLKTVFPGARLQCCVATLQRESLRHVATHHQQDFCRDAWSICTANSENKAKSALELLKEAWPQYHEAVQMWEKSFRCLVQRQEMPITVRQVTDTLGFTDGFHATFAKTLRDSSPYHTEEMALKAIFWRALEGLIATARHAEP